MFLAMAMILAGPYGPGPEAFPGVGHMVFRQEAESIARKVAASRNLAEPVSVVEVRVEATSMTPGGRGWSVVVVGGVPGGCHAVTVGLDGDDGRAYAVGDRRAVPPTPPGDCERWYILGGAEGATATLETAPIRATPPPPPVIGPSRRAAPRALTRSDAGRIAIDQATKKGYTGIEPQRALFRPAAGGRPGVWRVDLIGLTPKGCGIFKLELAEPDWKMRYQNNQMAGRGVQLEECREWYAREGGQDDPADWLPGRVEWESYDYDNRQ